MSSGGRAAETGVLGEAALAQGTGHSGKTVSDLIWEGDWWPLETKRVGDPKPDCAQTWVRELGVGRGVVGVGVCVPQACAPRTQVPEHHRCCLLPRGEPRASTGSPELSCTSGLHARMLVGTGDLQAPTLIFC